MSALLHSATLRSSVRRLLWFYTRDPARQAIYVPVAQSGV
jgi:hypothetical protein